MYLVNVQKEYAESAHTIYSCQYHVIFSTKYCRKVLIDGVELRLKELIMEKQGDWGYKILEIEIMPDHVHLLVNSNPEIGINNQINHIKGYTSRILREEFAWLRSRIPSLWTRSKFISTVGSVSLESIKTYIENQKTV